jgi:hypothetical protein
MADLEPSADSPGPEAGDDGGGISSFLNSTRNVIASITALIVAVSGLLLALNRRGSWTETTTTAPARPRRRRRRAFSGR